MERLMNRRTFLKTAVVGGAALLEACTRQPEPVQPIPTPSATPQPPPFEATPYIAPEQKESMGFWQEQSIDTMKLSRDKAREMLGSMDRDENVTDSRIVETVIKVKELNANYIALGTPYDEAFYPVLKTWVDEARKAELHIWFRGNLSGWEGWFDVPPTLTLEEHHEGITKFVTSHPELFQEGDIFTPAPEAENGTMNRPDVNPNINHDGFFGFIDASYDNAQQAFAAIEKTGVKVGYFSSNGDVALKYRDYPQLVRKLGNIIVMDHYTKTIDDFEKYIIELAASGAKVGLGEFGAPIPDLQGEMTEEQQADYIKQLLSVLIKHKDKVELVNYWDLADGSTALLRSDFSEKPAFQVVRSAYNGKIP